VHGWLRTAAAVRWPIVFEADVKRIFNVQLLLNVPALDGQKPTFRWRLLFVHSHRSPVRSPGVAHVKLHRALRRPPSENRGATRRLHS
jgi:hypothetical protein